MKTKQNAISVSFIVVIITLLIGTCSRLKNPISNDENQNELNVVEGRVTYEGGTKKAES